MHHVYECADQDSMLHHSERRIYKMMIGFSKFGRNRILVARSVIQKKLGYSESTARRALKKLEDLGYIVRQATGGSRGRWHDGNLYRIDIPLSYQQQLTVVPKKSPAELRQIAKKMLVKQGVDASAIDELLAAADAQKIIGKIKKSPKSLASYRPPQIA